MALITIDRLHKRFGPLEVLKGVDISIEAGRSDRHHRQERIGQEHDAALRERLETYEDGQITVDARRSRRRTRTCARCA